MIDIENLARFDAEQSVLGSCLIDNEAIDKVSFLECGDFYSRQHQVIFKKILEMHSKGDAIDAITISESFNDDELENIGGFAYLIEVSKNTPSARNAVAYADIVRDMSSRRKAIIAMQNSIEQLCDLRCKSVSVVSELEDELDKTFISAAEADVLTVNQLIDMSIKEMEYSQSNARSGISSGIKEIDQRLGYRLIAFGEITVLGGLSKNGKTLTANTILARAGYQGNESAHVFSIEMPAIGMFNGIISAMSGIPSNFYDRQEFYSRVFPGEYDLMMAKWGTAAQELNQSGRVTIDGTKQVDADYICANMKKQFAIHRNNGKRLRLVVIDHLHRMDYKTGGQPLTYAIRDAVRKIKNTASELGIAVVALCQLRNDAEGKDPTSFYILDSSAVRHEMQAFIGTRIFRQDGGTYFGIYGDSQRYGDMDTLQKPAYMKLQGGVLRSLKDGEYFTPEKTE